ncbi:hypothetical protein ABT095_02235 [Kitasatospora sp. NPDC002227]|uniref:hypothetical protein n=1 Tax=Kitasatospora sp. NPDC002227 TaxID=3154773 RepID=UPI003324572D
MSPAASAVAVRRGEQPPLDSALRRSIRLAAAKADAATSRPFPSSYQQDHHMNPVADTAARHAAQATELQIQNRTLEMHLMHENLARAHMQERLQEAEHERQGVRVARAARLVRRAERASLRARKALALAVM